MKVLITGASEGIGKAIALELAKKGHELLLLARNTEKLNLVKDMCAKEGALSASVFSVDLRDSQQISDFCQQLKELDGVINNAGIWQKKSPLDEIPESELLNVIATNLTGLISLTQKVLPLLRKSQNGFVVNISSRSGYAAQAGQSVYSATKYGVRGFTEVLREDLLDSGIRVAGIYQGGTNTQMFNKAGENFAEEKLATFIPTEELAKVVSFLIERPKGVWLPEIKVENK
ncbi:MAG: SDR family oxidoreductase [Patescibacteria group bacterium]